MTQGVHGTGWRWSRSGSVWRYFRKWSDGTETLFATIHPHPHAGWQAELTARAAGWRIGTWPALKGAQRAVEMEWEDR